MNILRKISALVVLSALATAVNAQDVSSEKVTIEVSKAPVASALKALFNHRAKFTLAKDVKGTVTLDAKDIRFETALRYILAQVDATYSYANGNYTITRKKKSGS